MTTPNTIDEFFSGGKRLKAGDLQGRRVVVTIARVAAENVAAKDSPPEMKPVLYLEGKEKSLVLNRTNAGRIAEVVGSRRLSDWVGQRILLYPTTTDYNGKRVDCIRVDAPQSVTAPPPPPVHGDEIPF